jgi:hypothetical protein
MAPKMMRDEDGDIPPCSVMYSIDAMNNWESFKESKYEFKPRRAACTCRYFDGIMPFDHKCYVPTKVSLFKKWLNSIRYIFRKTQHSI